jgi:AcrR family transcriptional regulator
MAVPPQTDGRRRRSETSRGAIVAAMLDLVREGAVAPGAEEVAARAGVGLRSVFRHFENMESLYREINAMMLAEIRPLAERPYAAKTWRAVLDEMIGRRADIFERILPEMIASSANRHKSHFLEGEAAHVTREQRAALKVQLPKALCGGVKLEALDLALSFETWRRLRKDQKLSPARACAVIAEIVSLLVD